MSAYRDTSQKFKFDYKNNFYLLYKQSKFDVMSTSPVVMPYQQEAEVNVQYTKFEQFKNWVISWFA